MELVSGVTLPQPVRECRDDEIGHGLQTREAKRVW